MEDPSRCLGEGNLGGGLTRAGFLRRAAGGGAGLFLLGGGGSAAYELLAARPAVAAERDSGRSGTVQVFHSRPDLRPPAVEVVHPARDVAPGYVFIAPSSGPGQRGVLMLDDAGEVVWFHPTTPHTAMNFRAATYRGEPVLTWWEGKSEKGTGHGRCVIVDGSYREIARFEAAGHRLLDLHEFLVTPQDTALVTSTETRTMDLRSLGGRSRWPVTGSVVQELEIPSGRVLFEWHSLDHVALEESHQKIGPRFDYFHANSIDLDGDGNLLVSARNTWAVYKVSRRTGAVIWRLGGKKSDFAMGKGTVFAWQHDARSHDGGTLISIFDDGAAPKVEPQSRAIEISLDERRKRATLHRKYTHHPSLLAKYTGSMQLLENGDVLVGWGSEPYFTEFARDGSVRFDARLPRGGQTYRALRFPWAGRPSVPPKAVPARGPAGTVVYASWNGATAVSSWQLVTGASPSALQPALTAPRRGFETELAVPPGTSYAAVVALDEGGGRLGSSATIGL